MQTRKSGTVIQIVENSDTDSILDMDSAQSAIQLLRIPGGSFMMGSPVSERGRHESESPVHRVKVDDFYLSRHPVTNAQYRRFIEANPGAHQPVYWDVYGFNQPSQPAVGVSWDDAGVFCQWAGLRLPSEAEWEYACRAGTDAAFGSGHTAASLAPVAWYRDNAAGKPHPVGEKRPNGFGLYDMHGNVWEWVEDDWHDSYLGAPADGTPWVDEPRAKSRVLRGGSWNNGALDCRSAIRNYVPVAIRNDYLGFRVARSLRS